MPDPLCEICNVTPMRSVSGGAGNVTHDGKLWCGCYLTKRGMTMATATEVREHPILFSVTTGRPSQRGQRLKSKDGLTWKQRNRDAVNRRRRDLYAADPEKHRARQRSYKKGEAKQRVLKANRKWSAAYRAKLRAEMIVAYGGSCACCGETELAFLQLDHVENDGHVDRKSHKTSCKLFAKLKQRGWPRDRYQLLCANCNFGKLMNGGICPHKSSGDCHG